MHPHIPVETALQKPLFQQRLWLTNRSNPQTQAPTVPGGQWAGWAGLCPLSRYKASLHGPSVAEPVPPSCSPLLKRLLLLSPSSCGRCQPWRGIQVSRKINPRRG